MVIDDDLIEKATSENTTSQLCLSADVPIRAKVLRVIDGDTLVCAIVDPMSCIRSCCRSFEDDVKFKSIIIRLCGVDTPERHPKKRNSIGDAADNDDDVDKEKEKEDERMRELEIKAANISLKKTESLVNASKMLVTVIPICSTTGRGSSKPSTTFDVFGRVIADVIVNDGSGGDRCYNSLGDILVRDGFARVCTKQTAGRIWCEKSLQAIICSK